MERTHGKAHRKGVEKENMEEPIGTLDLRWYLILDCNVQGVIGRNHSKNINHINMKEVQ